MFFFGQVKNLCFDKFNPSTAAYSVGHVLNDLCAAMWFSYLLVYFHQILQLDAATAGYLLLIGQLTDGCATPFVGIESDRVGLLGRFYGRRKSWHLFGTSCVILSFIFIFTPGKKACFLDARRENINSQY